MRIIVSNHTNPYFNLATEEYLLEHTNGGIFMLWRNEPCVVIGKNQNAFAEINLDFTNAHNIKVVRRLTGGGAVFHDLGNVNFTFIAPAGEGPQGLDFAYFTRPVIDALAGLGVEAGLSGRNDIVVHTDDGERKISGNAQCVYNAADGSVKTMHHGTLLFSADMSRMQGALNVDPTKLASKGIRSVRSRVANLIDLLPPAQREQMRDVPSFMDYLADYGSRRFDVPVGGLTDEETTGIQSLMDAKYSTDLWNLRRFGSFETVHRRRFDFGLVEVYLSVREGLLSSIRFGGDFFGVRDVGELSAMLEGTVFDRENVGERLCSANVNGYIAGAEAEDLLELIFNG